MGKRRLDADVVPHQPPLKRNRLNHPDHLTRLSDELLLRILSYLEIRDLNTCQRLNHRLHGLAADSQIWKSHYYRQYVRPRAKRIKGIRDADAAHLEYSSKVSRWLDEENLVRRGRDTNWKRHFKLRHNWSRGRCNVEEIEVSDIPPIPPILLRMHAGIVFTVDATGGLRAWSMRAERKLLGKLDFPNSHTLKTPTALAVDTGASDRPNTSRLIVGFDDGSFSLFHFGIEDHTGTFSPVFEQPRSTDRFITAVALHDTYLLTMTATQLLSIYCFDQNSDGHGNEPNGHSDSIRPPYLLHALRSHTVMHPLSLSIRPSPINLTISIAYTFKTFFGGWTVGIQEFRIDADDGSLLGSRVAHSPSTRGSTNDHYVQSQNNRLSLTSSRRFQDFSLAAFAAAAAPAYTKPTSLSYTHPYLLLSHPDNTLTLYLITSNDDTLGITPGRRLWGHTSGISGAQIAGTGKAVSVSRTGQEIRVWELEGASQIARFDSKLTTAHEKTDLQIPTQFARRYRMRDAGSVKLEPSMTHNLSSSGEVPQRALPAGDLSAIKMATGRSIEEITTFNTGWVGFDEESVVVLREELVGKTALVVYDFS